MHIAAAIATPTGVTMLWHAIMPKTACWLTHKEVAGCVLLFFLAAGVAASLKIFLEGKDKPLR